jgi:hypothetical protein
MLWDWLPELILKRNFVVDLLLFFYNQDRFRATEKMFTLTKGPSLKRLSKFAPKYRETDSVLI